MTQEEKIEMLKETIVQLYEKEGRSQVYISDLLKINRKTLGLKIKQWELVKADERYLKPSNQKFLNKNRKIILDMLNSDCSMIEISEKIGKSRHSLLKTFIQNDRELLHRYNQYKDRLRKKTEEKNQKLKDKSSLIYDFEDLEGEVWKEVLGFEKYQVSNMGRVKRWSKRYKSYHLVQTTKNTQSGYIYVSLVNDKTRKTFSLARLVAHAFVPGYSEQNNTVDHKDTDKSNNKANNLEWISQSENNARAYQNGRKKVVGYSKIGRFKEIVVDNKYRFKTVVALAKFLGVSESQAHRYIDGETKIERKIEIIY